MILRLIVSLLCATTLLVTQNAHGDCNAVQSIEVKVGDKQIAAWKGLSDEMHSMVMANGFKLGLKVEAASRESYDQWLKRSKSQTMPEMLRISVYDLSNDKPRLITYTYGGANGRQGYTPKGGAARVDEVGEPGITLHLHKQICLNAAAIAALPTAADLKQVEEKIQPNAQELKGQEAAQADVAAGKIVVSYPKGALSDAELAVVKTEVEKTGLKFQVRDDEGDAATRSFKRGYESAMMDAVMNKLGKEKSREMERNIKARIAELKAK